MRRILKVDLVVSPGGLFKKLISWFVDGFSFCQSNNKFLAILTAVPERRIKKFGEFVLSGATNSNRKEEREEREFGRLG